MDQLLQFPGEWDAPEPTTFTANGHKVMRGDQMIAYVYPELDLSSPRSLRSSIGRGDVIAIQIAQALNEWMGKWQGEEPS